MKPYLILLPLAVGLLLAGCSKIQVFKEPEDQSRMALACETVRCDCEQPKKMIAFSTPAPAPVQWRPEGTAYCPEGFLLTRLP